MLQKSIVSNIVSRILLLFGALLVIVPISWLFIQSLKTNQEFFVGGTWSLPAIPKFSNYKKALTNLNISTSLINTTYLVGISLVIGTVVSVINAFVLTRLTWKGKKFVWSLIMLSLFLPGINAIIPQYVLMRSLHLTNKITGLIILYSFGLNAFDLLVLSGFMQTIPKELEESAYIDGASIFKVFSNIIVPLSVPGIVTIAVFKFISLYNDFLGPLIFIGDSKKYTIGVNMYHANMLMQYKADWTTLCAGVVITIIPSLLVYIFFQKSIVEGATLGAIKG